MLLELALWKSKIVEQFNWNKKTPLAVDRMMECRADSLMMVAIIVPNVLSFLTDGDDDNDGVGRDVNDGNSVDEGDRYIDDESVEDGIDWSNANNDYSEDYYMDVNYDFLI